MITSAIGTAVITHEPDWTGSASVAYNGSSYAIPGDLAYLLINSSVDIVTLQRDFEALRRQAAAYRITVTDMIDNLASRIKTLEALLSDYESRIKTLEAK